MIACALIPRLSLLSALNDRKELLGKPVALAPEPGGPQVIGQTSGAAEAFGLRAGMRLGEALSRCPNLTLVAADPVRATAVWEESLSRLEGIGAQVEAPAPGEAFFETAPLHGIYGPRLGSRGGAEAVLVKARRALGPPAKLGGGANRLCAREAATRMRARRAPMVVGDGAAARVLAELPVASLRGLLHRPARGRSDHAGEMAEATCIDSLERLGVMTLGELAALPAAAISDRFGRLGLRALQLARGGEEPLRPRMPSESIECRLALPEAASGQQLDHALGLLIDRLLAHKQRGARTIRRLRLEARLAAGGGWHVEVVMRSASSSAERLRLAIGPRLVELPGPAIWIGLRAIELGPPAGDQRPLADTPADERRGRIVEAVRQARAAAGRDALLRVVEVDHRSRVPERRAMLAPFLEPKRR